MKTYTYSVDAFEFDLVIGEDAFMPNSTSLFIDRNVVIPKGARVLDLGCGVGPHSIVAAKRGAREVHAVEILPQASELAKLNVNRHNLDDLITIYTGSLYDPLPAGRYDVIIDGVSAVAELPARVSGWYPAHICCGGFDGTSEVVPLIEDAPRWLAPGGVLYITLSSLANCSKSLAAANKCFGKVKLIDEKKFPFPTELYSCLDELRSLRDDGIVSFEEKGSRCLWTIMIFEAMEPVASFTEQSSEDI